MKEIVRKKSLKPVFASLVLLLTFQLVFSMNEKMEKATLGGGCFWCTEAVFSQMRGVETVLPGYSGGHVKNPSYKEVCTGTTGHAEVVQVVFDPSVVSYSEILDVFFSIHDPTSLNRQGADEGTQYRSVIFYHTEEQKKVAEIAIIRLTNEKAFDGPLVTEVAPFTFFYPAEDYHRDYFEKNRSQPYCRMVVAPKVKKFYKQFKEMVK